MGLFKRIGNEIIYLRAALRSLSRLGDIYKHPNETFPDLIEGFARNKPNNIAIYFEDRKITYRELDEAANRYARWAIAQGLGKGHVVAVMMENRPEYIIAWLGVLKAGAAAASSTQISSRARWLTVSTYRVRATLLWARNARKGLRAPPTSLSVR